MKLRKILSVVVAAAIAASMAVSASAANVVASRVNSTAFPAVHLSGSVSFVEVNITEPETTMELLLDGWHNLVESGAVDIGDRIWFTNFKIGGDDTAYRAGNKDGNSEVVGTDRIVGLITAGGDGEGTGIDYVNRNLYPITFRHGQSSYGGNGAILSMGKYSKLTVECDLLVLNELGNVDENRTRELAAAVATGKQVNLKIGDIVSPSKDTILIADKGNGSSKTSLASVGGSMAMSSTSSVTTDVVNHSTRPYVNFSMDTPNGRLTLEEQAVVRAATTATLEAIFKSPISSDIATVKAEYQIADGPVRTLDVKAVSKGATGVTFDVPMTLLYEEAFGNVNQNVTFWVSFNSTGAKIITNLTLTVFDANAPADSDAAGEDEDEDADADEDEEVEDDDSEDLFDDEDEDFEDEDEDETGDDEDEAGDAGAEGADGEGAGTGNPITGVSVAAIPALVAGAAALVARKRK